MPRSARRTRRSHEIIVPWSAAEDQKVNNCRADEVFGEHAKATPDFPSSCLNVLTDVLTFPWRTLIFLSMSTKSSQLQIRVSPEEKTLLKELAKRSGLDVSRYVLQRVLPANRIRFHGILQSLRDDETWRFGLADLNDLLSDLSAAEFGPAVESVDLAGLSSFLANYVCALVEQAAHLCKLPPPEWTKAVEPLSEPYFAAPFASLRPHLLRASPVPFRRRQLFVDSSLGDRV